MAHFAYTSKGSIVELWEHDFLNHPSHCATRPEEAPQVDESHLEECDLNEASGRSDATFRMLTPSWKHLFFLSSFG